MINPINILYLGEDNTHSTSFHRAMALKRLGHAVDIKNPRISCNRHLSNSLLNKLHYRTGYYFLQSHIENWLREETGSDNDFDLIWINGGELLGPKNLQYLRTLECPVILYNNDDPTGRRDGSRFKSLIKAVPYYDLCAVVRDVSRDEFNSLGCKNTIRVKMSYDEVAHRPFALDEEIPIQFRSEVAFIGTWMRYEKRDEFLLQLIEAGVPVTIWGNRWQKSPLWSKLEPHYRGGALGGRDYVAAIQGAKICIGMLSKGNRDLHTQRSLEIPYIGGLLCAERTSEHLTMYEEGVEAMYWDDAGECAEACKKLLANDGLRESIRLAGMRKVRKLELGNEDVCRRIIDAVCIEKTVY